MATLTPTMGRTPMTTNPGTGRPRILVAGLGNLLLMDDGVGVHAVQRLAHLHSEQVCVVEVGTAVLDALHLIEWADKILALDAMEAGGAPGQVYIFGEDAVASGRPPVSLHELGLKAAFGFLSEPPSAEIAIVGVEPQRIAYGLELSPPVAAALPTVVQTVERLVSLWLTAGLTAEADVLELADVAG
jgi:hydrogenase maturation protease